MGSAQSSNTAKSVAKIANSVSSNTSTTNKQVTDVVNRISLNNCDIGGDVNIKIKQEFMAKSVQIVEAFQQSNIQNNIAQQMMQAASSTVGSLGIGYASATNYASTFVSATNDIVNSVYTFSNQASFFNTTIKCDGSSIGGDYNIDINTANNFWNDQGVKSDQISDIANTIDQKISQTATAKVEGLGGFLIGLIAIIGAILYAVAAPVGEAMSSFKIVIAVFVIFGLLLLIVWLWLIEWYPFFSPLKTCSVSGLLLDGQCAPKSCKEAKKQTVNIEHPPLKYMFGVVSRGASRSMTAYGMLNMMLTKNIDTDVLTFNQGFNAKQCLSFTDNEDPDKAGIAWKEDNTYKEVNLPPLPNPLFIPDTTDKDGNAAYFAIPSAYITQDPDNPNDGDGGSKTPSVAIASTTVFLKKDFKEDKNLHVQTIAVLNDNAWEHYLNVTGIYSDFRGSTSTIELEKIKRSLHARYILASFLEIDNNLYIFSGEKTENFDPNGELDDEVFVNGDMQLASKSIDLTYKYGNFRPPPFNDYSYGIVSSGSLEGLIGICDNRSNKLTKFLSKSGNYILLVILLIIVGMLFYFGMKKKKT
jgi:hypothetical protein